MKHVLQMQRMRKELERECVCEDSKTRIYLSVMPSRAVRLQRFRDTVGAVTTGLRIFFGPVLNVIVQILLTTGITMLTYEILAYRMASIRGYEAWGGEVFISMAMGIITFKALNYTYRKK